MKSLFIFASMLTFLHSASWAAQTDTECAYMRESNIRNNPKANAYSVKTKNGKPQAIKM